jgi:hypothetical protein
MVRQEVPEGMAARVETERSLVEAHMAEMEGRAETAGTQATEE